MKDFWALPALWRVTLVLAAQRHSFSVNDDLLAYPQYQIQWSDDYISESLAESKLHHGHKNDLRLEREDSSQDSNHIERYKPPPTDTKDKTDNDNLVFYEEMVRDRQRYLCAIPDVVLEEHDEQLGNDTLSKIEEEKELARANERGWELISGMQGNCIYYNSGWWSYSFCFDAGVRQFHQVRGVSIWPPVEDPNVNGFTLGKVAKIEKSVSKIDEDGVSTARVATPGELVVKGDTRYLMQKMEGGTECDLTGDPRRVEVQFHCNPSVGLDMISLIKETSTCQYLLVVQTPRLCNDVAFLPPQKDQPNNIVCQPILASNEVEQYKEEMDLLKEIRGQIETQLKEDADASQEKPLQLVGDIVVGGHNIVPKDVKLEKSAIVGGEATVIATVATSDGHMMSKAEMEKLNLGSVKSIENLAKRLNKLANGKGWKLDVVETANGREYRGIIDGEPAHDPEDESNEEGSQEEFYKEEL